MSLPLALPEVASAKLKAHLAKLYENADFADPRLAYVLVDELHAIVPILARKGEDQDLYYVRLGAEHYDAYPPIVVFVQPNTWALAPPKTRWFPKLEGAADFALHEAFDFKSAGKRPLICYSFNAEYYMTEHSPTPGQVWVQGKHTLAATVYRLTEIMHNYYKGSSAA
jgi:hypothetical protein